MTILAFYFLAVAGQMNSYHEKPVVHLRPGSQSIELQFGGKLLELINAPNEVHLPTLLPKRDFQGNMWCLDVKNLGPRATKIIGKDQVDVQIDVNQRMHICSNGTAYLVTR